MTSPRLMPMNEKGFAVLPFALIVAVVIAGIFMYVSGKSEQLISRYYISQAQSYALDLTPKLAMKVRWSYDIAKAEAVSPGLCGSYGGTLKTVGALNLCLVGAQICVPHPRDGHQVCISPDDSTMIAAYSPRRERFERAAMLASLIAFTLESARANAPTAPLGTDTSNALSGSPVCLNGNDCGATCTSASAPGTADCLTIKFCSLTTACSPNQMVWQTIALLK